MSKSLNDTKINLKRKHSTACLLHLTDDTKGTLINIMIYLYAVVAPRKGAWRGIPQDFCHPPPNTFCPLDAPQKF